LGWPHDFLLLLWFGTLVLLPLSVYGLLRPPSATIAQATACAVGVWLGVLSQITFSALRKR
jgi:hypothetical protein